MLKVSVRDLTGKESGTVDAPIPTIENVRSVYSGKPGCMCGCNGKHKVNPAFAVEAGADRGYACDDEDISLRSVKVIITKLLKAGAQTDEGKEKSYLFAEAGNRVYCVYFANMVK